MTVILAAILGAIVAVSLSPLAKWLYERTALYHRRREWRRCARNRLPIVKPLSTVAADIMQREYDEAVAIARGARLYRQRFDEKINEHKDE